VTLLVSRTLIASLLLPLACSTAYHARQPLPASTVSPTNDTVSHCLQSIGLADDSDGEWHAESISEDPELISIWATPPRSFWSAAPGCNAAVRLESRSWHVVFVPYSGSTSGAAQALSGAFEHCVELHEADADIKVNSEMFLDLR
jgi:hypothetical protein